MVPLSQLPGDAIGRRARGDLHESVRRRRQPSPGV